MVFPRRVFGTMLRKRTRSIHKDQQMSRLTLFDSSCESYFQSDCLGLKNKTNSFFSAPGLFVGLSPKGLSDCDSARSPTSPLDFRMVSNLGNPYRSPRSPHNRNQKCWDCCKVGLSIVDSLDDDMKGSGKVLQSSESKNILFGSEVRLKTPNFQMHTNSFEAPKSLPKNFAIFSHTHSKSPLQKGNSDVLFEIGEAPLELEPFGKIRSCSLDSCRSVSTLPCLSDQNLGVDNVTTQVNFPLPLFGQSPNSNNFSHKNLTSTAVSVGSGNGFIGPLPASEIELSEDYTCVISHGPNPKKTHIYGDCILECRPNDLSSFGKNEGKEIGSPQANTSPMIPSPFPSTYFLSFCGYCNKKLEEGKDIYIYRFGPNAL